MKEISAICRIGFGLLFATVVFAQPPRPGSSIPTESNSSPTEVIRIIDPDMGPGADYPSLQEFATRERRDLVAANEIAVAICRSSNGTPDSPAQFKGWVTDSLHYIKVVADSAHRATARWDDTKYRIIEYSTINSECIDVEVDYFFIDGIQMRLTGTGPANDVIDPEPIAHMTVQNCFLWLDLDSLGSGTGMDPANDVKLYNNIIKGSGKGNGVSLRYVSKRAYLEAYNNTFIGWERAIKNQGICRAVNNLVRNSHSDQVFWALDGGIYTDDSDYNSSDRPGTALVRPPRDKNQHPWYNGDVPDEQIFFNAGANDFHLRGTAILRNAGVGPDADSDVPRFDIDIDLRNGPTTDLGADFNANQPFTAGNDAVSVDEDQSVEIEVLANDSDPENDPLTIREFSQGRHGTVSLTPGNRLQYVPDSNYFGPDTFTYIAEDTGANIDSALVMVQVQPVNDPPRVDLPAGATFPEDSSFTLDLNNFVQDIDSDLGAFIWSAEVIGESPPGLTANLTVSIDPLTHVATLQPAPDFFGDLAVRFIADDNSGGPVSQSSDTMAVTVTPRNDPPVLTLSALSFSEDQSLQLNLNDLVRDVDSDPAALSWNISVNSGSVSVQLDPVAKTATLSAAPDFFGSDISVEFTVTDDSGATDIASTLLTIAPVNDAPVFTAAPPALYFNEDASLNQPLSAWSGLASDIDNDEASLVFAVTGGSQISVQSSGDQILFSAPPDWFGSETLALIVSDGFLSDTAAFAVTVQPVNDAPVVEVPPIEFPENLSITLWLDSLVSDVDSDPAAMTWTAAASVPEVYIQIDPDTRSATISAAEYFNGTNIPVWFTASDDSGGSDTDTTHVTILPVNQPPVITAAIPDLSFPEDGALTVLSAGWFPLVEDPDHPDTALVFSLSGGLQITAQPLPGGFRFGAPPDWFGSETFTLIVSDGFLSDTAAFAVTVQPVNDAPVVEVPPIEFPEDSRTQFDLDTLVSDVDSDTATITWTFGFAMGDSLAGSIRKNGGKWVFSTPASDSIVIALDPVSHIVTVSATPNFFDTAIPVWFTATDDSGASASDTTTITVSSINDAPVISALLPDSLRLRSGETDSLHIWEFVADVETPAAELIYQFSATTDSLLLHFNGQTGYLHLTTAENYHGQARVFISVSDDSSATVTDSITVIVEPLTSIDDPLNPGGIPREFVLAQNYPNPFNPATKIRFGLPRAVHVTVTIYNLLGEKVAILVNEARPAGYHVLDFRADGLASGLYLYHIRAGEFQAVRKMLLVK